MKTTTLHLSAAFRALVPAALDPFSGVFLDAGARVVIATDGSALAILPFPDDFSIERNLLIPTGPEAIDADPASGTPIGQELGWQANEEIAAASPPT